MCSLVSVRAAGVFPFRTAMAEDRPKAGYVEVTPTAACPLFPPGQPARGYVHHCSEILQVRRFVASREAHQRCRRR